MQWQNMDCFTKVNDHMESYVADKKERKFFQTVGVSELLHRCTTWTLWKRLNNNQDGTT